MRQARVAKDFNVKRTGRMKIAISIEAELLQEADKIARQMGLTRSQIFATAVDDFVKRQGNERMLLQLNAVYAGGMKPAEKRLLNGMKAKFVLR